MANPFEINPMQRSYGLEDLELFGDESYPVGIPYNCPPELKLYILAAIKTYRVGNKSIDHMLKSYRSTWERKFKAHTSEQTEFENILSELKSEVIFVAKQLTTPVQRPEHDGLFAAEAALVRLNTSFRTAILLVRQLQLFETAAILRLIFEQISWIYAIYTMTGEAVFKVEPTKTISKFKEIFPDAGGYYGQLSELAHISPENTLYYIQIDGKNAQVRLNSSKTKWLVTYLLAVTVDLYKIVTEYVLVNILDRQGSIILANDGTITVNEERSIVPLLDTVRAKLEMELSNP